ncbi:hypothetical protein LO772_32640 [Yinghuangia sp. ASG 101]|uniref:COG4705 family protein n=1 Tax=Yinghuangia sp. ASG 101 TaxID=2896848 RepID=UPI001E62B830|nr:hypothetical protein [Yinghuangia sp. ASG 101]UGQ11481.1 hypothetical protein LO772_32640 [Yinghuangia sp. ASG 101]
MTTRGRAVRGVVARVPVSKVPEVTAYFWAVKVLSTTVGETGADFVIDNVGLGLAGTSVLAALVLAVALCAQVRASRYVPGLYWTAVVLVSVVGTLLSDNLTDNVGVPLEVSTAGFAVLLGAVFAMWWAREGTLSIRSVVTRRRELFYWSAVLVTFALGTAAGDLLAERLDLGYRNSVLVFAATIAVVLVAHYGLPRGTRLGAVGAFWAAYVLTRPLGASLGDWLAQPHDAGGLGLGVTATSLVFLAAILGLVAYLSLTRIDTLDASAPTAGDLGPHTPPREN